MRRTTQSSTRAPFGMKTGFVSWLPLLQSLTDYSHHPFQNFVDRQSGGIKNDCTSAVVSGESPGWHRVDRARTVGKRLIKTDAAILSMFLEKRRFARSSGTAVRKTLRLHQEKPPSNVSAIQHGTALAHFSLTFDHRATHFRYR